MMISAVRVGQRYTRVPSILNPLPRYPSRLSQSTGFGCPVSYIKFPLVICFTYNNVYVCVCQSLSCVRLFATPWTVACQAPLSMGFFREEYWSGLPFPSPGDPPNPGIKPGSSRSQAESLPSEPTGKPNNVYVSLLFSQIISPFPSTESKNLSFVHVVLQARILAWVAIHFSRGSEGQN